MCYDGNVRINADIQSINILKPANVTRYSKILRTKSLLMRLQDEKNTELVDTLIKIPNAQCYKLNQVSKLLSRLKIYPSINKTYLQRFTTTDDNIIIDIANSLKPKQLLDNPLSNTDISNYYRYEHTETVNIIQANLLNFVFPINKDPYIYTNADQIPNGYIKVEEGSTIEENITDKLIGLPKEIILQLLYTQLYQNFNYTDKTLTEPIDLFNDDKLYILDKNNIKFTITVMRHYTFVEDSNSPVFIGNNIYQIKFTYMSKIDNTKTKNYFLPISEAIITPYDLRLDFFNTISLSSSYAISININYIEKYIWQETKDSELQTVEKTTNIPLYYILDKYTYPKLISNSNLNLKELNPLNYQNTELLIQNINLKYDTVKTLEYLTSIPILGFSNVSVDANKDPEDTKVYLNYTSYPTKYYKPRYGGNIINGILTNEKPQNTGFISSWKNYQHTTDNLNLNSEQFTKLKIEEDFLIQRALNQLGFNSITWAFKDYIDKSIYYAGDGTNINKPDKNGIYQLCEKVPFRDLKGIDKNNIIEESTIQEMKGSIAQIDFSLAVYKGKTENEQNMSQGEIAYTFYFFKHLIASYNNTTIKKMNNNYQITNIYFTSPTIFTDKLNITKRYLINNASYTEYNTTKDSSEYIYKNYQIELNKINTNNYNIKLYYYTKSKTHYIEVFISDIIDQLSINITGIGEYADDINGWNTTILKNRDLTSEDPRYGIQLPIILEAYNLVPIQHRIDVFINSCSLMIYSVGIQGYATFSEAWNIFIQVLSMLAVIISLALTLFTFGATSPLFIASLSLSIGGVFATGIINMLVASGVIDEKTASYIKAGISIVTSITTLGVGIANAPNTALSVANAIIDGLDLVMDIANLTMEIVLDAKYEELQNDINKFQTSVENRIKEFEDAQERINYYNKLAKEDIQQIFCTSSLGYGLTPTQFFNNTTTIGFNYDILYNSAYDEISNFVDNNLKLK